MRNAIKYIIIYAAIGVAAGLGLGATAVLFAIFVSWDLGAAESLAVLLRFCAACGTLLGVWAGIYTAIVGEQSNDD